MSWFWTMIIILFITPFLLGGGFFIVSMIQVAFWG
jgi:hypothetical protein